MHFLLLSLPIVLPAAFWAVYHYQKDRQLPEPLPNLLLAFGLGIIAFAIGKLLYIGLGAAGLRHDAFALARADILQLSAYALLAIGPIEELAKALPFIGVILWLKAFDERLDGIIYASFIALGYAAVENWLYIDSLPVAAAYARGFAGPVVHIAFASIWGYIIGVARLRGRPILRPALGSVALAALLHGLYDIAVLRQPHSALPLAALLIVALWLWRLRLMRTLADSAARER